MATGLVQDLVTGVGEQSAHYLERIMALLYKILEDAEMTTDVKTIAIQAIGDICLMTEAAFRPYFERSMDTLIAAGQMSIQIDHRLPKEDQQQIHELRRALIDAFMSIINGIKSPHVDQALLAPNGLDPNGVNDLTFKHIQNMFFYVEGLIGRDDLQITSELAKQILDLYCDIVMLMLQDSSGVPLHNHNEFAQQLRRSPVHTAIQSRFTPFVPELNQLDGGETVKRFEETVNTHITSAQSNFAASAY
jgi:hypothetical protein